MTTATRWILTCLALSIPALEASAGVVKQVVFKSGEDGYNVYRIPTIVQAANGDLLAFAEARSGGDASEIDIVLKRSTDQGATWGDLEIVVENDHYRDWDGLPSTNVTAGNQTPVVDKLDPEHPGRIWMPFTLENNRVFVTYSDDNGKTWNADANGRAREITSDVKLESWDWYATGPVHGIQLTRGESAGRLIIPSDHNASGAWGSHVVYSDDHGLTWKLGAVDTHAPGSEVMPNENVAAQLTDGRVYFNTRTNGTAESNRAVAYSTDGGVTYDSAFAPDNQFTSPVVQNSVVRFRATDQGDAEDILLHSGPANPTARTNMTITISTDESDTWGNTTLIHSGPAAYSDLVNIDDQRFGVLWEAGDSLYDEILFGTIKYDDLNPSDINGIEGDLDQNGVVDSNDLLLFVSNWNPLSNESYFGGTDSYKHGDLNFDGIQDITDAILLRKHLTDAGVSTASLSNLFSPVPEPDSLSIVSLFGLSLFAYSRTADTTRRQPF